MAESAALLVAAVSEKPLARLDDGPIRYELKTPYRDGTNQVIFEPLGMVDTAFEISPSRFIRDGKPVFLPSYEEIKASKERFSEMSGAFQKETNPGNGRPLIQPHGHEAVYLNPPAEPLSTELMDELYDLPFTRYPHPSIGAPIPAYETVKHSIVTMRGCFGGCSFCSITEHEGRVIQSRSADSVLREVRALRRMDGFSGVISDVGGPTANMYQMKCKDERIEKACRRLSCVHPGVCENLITDHAPLVEQGAEARHGALAHRPHIHARQRDLAGGPFDPLQHQEVVRHAVQAVRLGDDRREEALRVLWRDVPNNHRVGAPAQRPVPDDDPNPGEDTQIA